MIFLYIGSGKTLKHKKYRIRFKRIEILERQVEIEEARLCKRA